MGSVTLQRRWSFDGFIEWERTQPDRHELVDGQVSAMTGGSTAHGAAGLTLLMILREHLRGGPCRVFWPDVRLRIGEDAFYPDVKVSRAAGDLVNAQYIEQPLLVTEILSPGTAEYDRGRKFDSYRRIDALQEYLLVDPDQRKVELRRRDADGSWSSVDVPADGVIDLQCIGCCIQMASLFEELPPEAH